MNTNEINIPDKSEVDKMIGLRIVMALKLEQSEESPGLFKTADGWRSAGAIYRIIKAITNNEV